MKMNRPYLFALLALAVIASAALRAQAQPVAYTMPPNSAAMYQVPQYAAMVAAPVANRPMQPPWPQQAPMVGPVAWQGQAPGVVPAGATQACASCVAAKTGSGCGSFGGTCDGSCSQTSPFLSTPNDPLTDGGRCATRWFDAHVEWMFLNRDNAAGTINFTSDGIPGVGAPNVVLDSSDLDFAEASAIRVTLARMVGPGTSIEGSWIGVANWSESAQATSANDNLYSVLSGFGNPPIFGGFLETDQASLHRIEYSSQLNSVEINLRRRMISPDCRIHSSWLVGARYISLNEDFLYFTSVDAHDDPLTGPVDPNERGPADMTYTVTTTNDLVGAQIGFDCFAALTPRFRIGGEIEAGLYANQTAQRTVIAGTTISPTLIETADHGDLSIVAEAGLMGTFRLTPRCTVRAGYQFIYMDGVALAIENFNESPPALTGPAGAGRTVGINDNGAVFYHGATVGTEWTW